MTSSLRLFVQASWSRVLSIVLASALLAASAPLSVSADEAMVCEEGEIFSEEVQACIPDPELEEDLQIIEGEGSDEFCSVVSDPVTQEEGEPAVVVSTLSAFWTAVISDAFWIWGEDPVATPEETTTEIFTRTFTISGIPSEAELHIAADDGFVAKLNGTLVGEADGMDSVNFTLEGQDTFSLDTALFIEGENTLTVEATNIAWGVGGENPAGILFRIDMEGVSCGTDGDGGGDDEDFGTLVIEKELEGSDEDAFFSFSITPEEGESSILVVETDGRYGNNETDLPEGWYTVSEIVPEGWTLSSVVCNDEDSIEFAKISEGESLSETIYLDEGEEITCVFINVKDSVEEDDDSNDGKTSSGPRSVSRGSVLGATTECSPLLTTYLGRSYANPVDEVTKLQNFLNETEGANIPVTGLFDPATEQAVRVFQAKYWEDVLKPWFAFPQFGVLDSDDTTGIVYKTTKWKVNELFCPGSEALPVLP